MKTPLHDAHVAVLATLLRRYAALTHTQSARGRQLWRAEDFGRHNLTRDFIEQRAEARLGAAPWQESLCP